MGQRLDNAKALYLEGIRDGRAAEAITAYTGSRYTQHSTGVKDGREGFLEFFTDFLDRNPVREIEIVRGFEDGQYVFVQAVQSLNDGEFRYVTADIFDTDDDAKMIEHWDMIAEMSGPNASGHLPADGPTEVTDLERTAQNKELVRRYLDEVLVGGSRESVEAYVAPGYVEHAPHGRDGIEGLLALLGDPERPVRYARVHRMIGSGDTVVALSELEVAGVATATMDLFRVEAGLIAEHWEVVEQITPQETWANGGKF